MTQFNGDVRFFAQRGNHGAPVAARKRWNASFAGGFDGRSEPRRLETAQPTFA
jgi:hypothetical protein